MIWRQFSNYSPPQAVGGIVPCAQTAAIAATKLRMWHEIVAMPDYRLASAQQKHGMFVAVPCEQAEYILASFG